MSRPANSRNSSHSLRGGDTSYPGLVWHDDRLWISYYSSHEGNARIYLAQLDFSPPNIAPANVTLPAKASVIDIGQHWQPLWDDYLVSLRSRWNCNCNDRSMPEWYSSSIVLGEGCFVAMPPSFMMVHGTALIIGVAPKQVMMATQEKSPATPNPAMALSGKSQSWAYLLGG